MGLVRDDWAQDIARVTGGLVYCSLRDEDGADMAESGVCEHDVQALCGLVPELGNHGVVDIFW